MNVPYIDLMLMLLLIYAYYLTIFDQDLYQIYHLDIFYHLLIKSTSFINLKCTTLISDIILSFYCKRIIIESGSFLHEPFDIPTHYDD
jgi:hypothetical protein